MACGAWAGGTWYARGGAAAGAVCLPGRLEARGAIAPPISNTFRINRKPPRKQQGPGTCPSHGMPADTCHQQRIRSPHSSRGSSRWYTRRLNNHRRYFAASTIRGNRCHRHRRSYTCAHILECCYYTCHSSVALRSMSYCTLSCCCSCPCGSSLHLSVL
jgi:hypothetical protein